MKNCIILGLLIFLLGDSLIAQKFDLSGEVRARYENRNGYKTLQAKDVDAGSFISQRTRLNFDYKKDMFKFKVTLQNVRVWGDVGTLSSDDLASSFHEAWAEAKLTDKISMRLGRQEIVYDDHRMFGNVGWIQQARSHDAFLFKYKAGNSKLDVGFALNSDSRSGVDNLYSNAAGYKSLQYAWYHGDFGNLGLSVLALNMGIEYLEDINDPNSDQSIDYMQTFGPRFTYKSGDLTANAAAYIQTGTVVDTDVNSYYFGADVGYKITQNFKLGLGVEVLSGKDMDDSDDELKSFAPLFGTNHKFNGWMDYFYVGNHGGSVGLMDIYGSLVYKKNKFSVKLIPHFFSSAATIVDGGEELDNALGTEVDLALGYKLSKMVSINAGYSQMFGTESLEALKGGDSEETNNWTWVMFTFKPHLFTHKEVQK